MTVLAGTQTQFRGATLQFATVFYDFDGNVTTPPGAVIEIAYLDLASDEIVSVELAMAAPAVGSTQWTAQWDSRPARDRDG